MTKIPRTPDQIVFSGGGLRCFWQGGFMSRLAERFDFAPERVAGVSGGALAGAAWIAGAEARLLEEMCSAFESQDRNLDLFAVGDDGFTPHQAIYREVVEAVLDTEAAETIASGPAFQILIGHPPEVGPPKLTGAALAAAYEAELHTINAPHFNWAETIGLTAELVDAREAARAGRIADLVCAAAVIPPVFDPPLWNGRPVVDGGMADQAPMPDPDEGETLVLLTRPYRNIPDVVGRTYVWPSEETPADKIDFTNPQKLRDTWSLGERDALVYLANC